MCHTHTHINAYYSKKIQRREFAFLLSDCSDASAEDASLSTGQSSLDGLLARDEP